MARLWSWPESSMPATTAASKQQASSSSSSRGTTTTTTTTTPNKVHSPRRPRLASRDNKQEVGYSSTSTSSGTTPTRPSTSSTAATEMTTTTTGTSSPRRRINSRDIARSYSGLYGFSDDLLPFEMNRQSLAPTKLGLVVLVYVAVLSVVYALCCLLPQPWTIVNAIHFVVSMMYIHWIKGSLLYNDEQGELNALTVWEQLEAGQGTVAFRTVLMIVPTVLTYVACHTAQYDLLISAFNALLWAIVVLAKLPFMNGVRIFGINRTVGIDDNSEEDDGKEQ